MQTDKDLFKKIILWAFEKQEGGFYWVELEKEFSLTKEQYDWALKMLRSNLPASENLVDHLRYDHAENADKFFITPKGVAIARSYMDVKRWYEKPIGMFFLGVLITVVGGYILYLVI